MRALIEALRFLSALPLPPVRGKGCIHPDVQGVSAYPWAGLVIGAVTAALAALGSLIMGVWGTAVLFIVIRIAVTGGLHMDGLADYADGMGGGRDADKSLKIMSDSRLGSFGVLMLISVCALQAVFTAEYLLAFDPQNPLPVPALMPLAAVPVMTRGTIPLLMKIFPAARQGELGEVVRRSITWKTIALTLISTALIVTGMLRLTGLMVWLAVLLVMLAFSWRFSYRLGGLTGDCYGAVIEIGDTAALLFFMLVQQLFIH